MFFKVILLLVSTCYSQATTITNYVEYNGCYYATINNGDPFSSDLGCENGQFYLPDGWEIPSNTVDVINVAQSYLWSTHVLDYNFGSLTTGNGYTCTSSANYLGTCNEFMYIRAGVIPNTYSTATNPGNPTDGCWIRILIRTCEECVVNGTCTTTTTGLPTTELPTTTEEPVIGYEEVDVWINEFHYDETGIDNFENIEIGGNAGTDLNSWKILLYDGTSGLVYDTLLLGNVVIPDEYCSVGFIYVESNAIQDAPGGIALVNGTTTVEFISYEGTFTAVDGDARGLTSVDIGVAESSSTPSGYSIQKTGSGRNSSDFIWSAPQQSTFGLVNNNQQILCDSTIEDNLECIDAFDACRALCRPLPTRRERGNCRNRCDRMLARCLTD